MAQQGKLESGGPHSVQISEHELERMISEHGLVVLDDLGSRQTVSDPRYEIVKMLLDKRTHKPLIVISNLSLDDLAKVYDQRVTERCGAGTVIDASALPDQRMATT